MRRLVLLAVTIAALSVALPAGATEDLGDGRCLQADGQEGVWDGTTADDTGCVTPAEYEAKFSPPALVDAGAIESFTDNGDGTVTFDHGAEFGPPVISTETYNPLDRSSAATPSLEPDAPTIREVLFGWLESLAVRVADFAGVIGAF